MIPGFNATTATNDFLQLLTVQLKNQNPLEPVKQENFIAQLAQFSTLEGVENLNASFQNMLQLQEINQGVSLVGRQIEYQDPLTGNLKSGRVSELFVEQGNIYLMVDGKAITVDLIASVK
jgi:flagellar basal-body rod modification protein FlgD